MKTALVLLGLGVVALLIFGAVAKAKQTTPPAQSGDTTQTMNGRALPAPRFASSVRMFNQPQAWRSAADRA